MHDYDLIPNRGHWVLFRRGRYEVGTYASRDEAVARCTELLQETAGSLKIFRANGTVEREESSQRLNALLDCTTRGPFAGRVNNGAMAY
jgi:Uncharacterized protein conserved in bacteria (DUF2188)